LIRFPELKACLKNPFFKYYFSQAASSSFQSLYDNVDGIQDSFAAFWKTVASYFKSNPHVIGYELLNEPWPGNIFQDFGLLAQPGKSDVQNLAPMYEKLAAAIRSVDDDKIIFFEPTVTDEVFLAYLGLTQVPGGSVYNNRSVLSYHVYCGLTNPNGDPYFRPLCGT
jgi:endoglycosylceramidase